jgi:hypothetical protein
VERNREGFSQIWLWQALKAHQFSSSYGTIEEAAEKYHESPEGTAEIG